MRFFQHIYGRVAQGYKGGTEGFQLAALSEALDERMDVVEQLNRLSFFNYRGGDGTQARYSFFQPSEGFLAFGCSRLSVDRTGSPGVFAHNFVCETSEFIKSYPSPVELLRTLPFIGSEQGLPRDRSLPPVEVDAPSPQANPDSTWRDFALNLVDVGLYSSRKTIPMVVLPESETWPALAEVFAALPRLEASQFTFSTLFIGGTDDAGRFRVVFVPEQKHVPTDNYVYTAISPENMRPSGSTPSPLISLWRARPDMGRSFLNLVDILRHAPERDAEAPGLLPGLLSTGSPFRNAAEGLRVPRLMSFLMRNPDYLVQYSGAGSLLHYGQLSDALWQNPEACLGNAFQAADRTRNDGLRDSLLRELAIHAISDDTALSFIPNLRGTGHIARFWDIAAALDITTVCRLAMRLRGSGFYNNELHEAVAWWALSQLRNERYLGMPEAVMSALQQVRGGLFRVVVHAAQWKQRQIPQFVRLREYELSSEQYARLLPAVWLVGEPHLSLSSLMEAVYSRDHRATFLRFLARALREYKPGDQEDLLEYCARLCGPVCASNQDLLEAIDESRDAGRLARHLRNVLQKLYEKERLDLLRLSSIEENSRRRRGIFGD